MEVSVLEIQNLIKDKLDEYGIEIYTDYALSDHEHAFMVEKMALFLDKEKKSLGISFHAESRPETVANNVLIFSEISEIEKIEIMESFIVDSNNRFVSGEKAFEEIYNKMIEQIAGMVLKEQSYSQLLMSNKGYEC